MSRHWIGNVLLLQRYNVLYVDFSIFVHLEIFHSTTLSHASLSQDIHSVNFGIFKVFCFFSLKKTTRIFGGVRIWIGVRFRVKVGIGVGVGVWFGVGVRVGVRVAVRLGVWVRKIQVVVLTSYHILDCLIGPLIGWLLVFTAIAGCYPFLKVGHPVVIDLFFQVLGHFLF